MSDEPAAAVTHRFQELKRLLAQYIAFSDDLPAKPLHGTDLGAPFEKYVLEARFVFPGLSPHEQEQIALVRLAGVNILGRQLMTRLSAHRLEHLGLRIEDRTELERITSELEADFVECKKGIIDRGTPERLTPVQRMFWEEWSNPSPSQPSSPD